MESPDVGSNLGQLGIGIGYVCFSYQNEPSYFRLFPLKVFHTGHGVFLLTIITYSTRMCGITYLSSEVIYIFRGEDEEDIMLPMRIYVIPQTLTRINDP